MSSIPAGSIANVWRDIDNEGFFADWADITVPCRLASTHKVDRYGNLHIALILPNRAAGEFFRYLTYTGLPLQMTLERAIGNQPPTADSRGQDDGS